MKVYEILTTEQLQRHREVLKWMLAEVELELTKRNEPALEDQMANEQWLMSFMAK